jgi:transposase
VLPASRHLFVRPVLTMDQRAWTECHVAAFDFLWRGNRRPCVWGIEWRLSEP